MRNLKFITCLPDTKYYVWQVHLWLESLKNLNHSNKAIVLIYVPADRENGEYWNQLINLYSEVKFHFYKDVDQLGPLVSNIYLPLIRPYVMWKYCNEFPEIEKDAIFYCDSDILFTKDFNINHLLQDEINYVSDTNSYINASYFDSKVKFVIPSKLEEYNKIDVLDQVTKIVGTSREIAEKNNMHSGGAQYILKNTNKHFWLKVMSDCINIVQYLSKINKEFFESENKGFQKWCADMWAVLWNTWINEQETKIVSELAFAWSPDPISKLETHTILHNAGITGIEMNGIPMFYKGKYHEGLEDPTLDEHLQIVLKNKETQKTCNWYYANKLQELKNKYNLTY